jgi:prepilin-type N-terminal cleavage/methylation domain-containing protein
MRTYSKRQDIVHSGERGYNLVEMLIAIAIFGVVLISIFTLFVLGTRNVYSGKQMTRAIAVGTLVTEDLSSLTQKDVLAAFGVTSTTTLGAVDVDTTRALPNDNYTGSILRKSNAITTGQDPRGLLARWQSEISTDNILSNGYVAIVLTPRNPWPLAATLTPGNATTMRVRVLVRWNEGGRARQVVMDTAKYNRP